MGNETSAQQGFDKLQKLINSSRFNESFLLLKNRMKNYPALKKDLEKLIKAENTYRYMLDYLAEGHKDPSKNDIIEQIRNSLHSANDILQREVMLTDSSDLYSSTRRLEQLRQTNILHYLDNLKKTLEEDSIASPNETLISPAQARTLDELFNYVWTMTGVDREEYEILSNALEDNSLPEYFKALMISALFLGNLSFFDPVSFEILLNQYETSESITVRARSIVGIILLSLLHSDRLSGNLNLRSRILLSAEDDDLKQIVNEVLLKIVRTYDTKRVDNKMRNEVIPGLMKLKPEILDKIRNMTSDSEDFLSNENPNWDELLENSSIGDKLQEINEMQMEGADVMVTAFSNLKSFPFFNQVSNWFLPFLPGHYEFSNLQFSRDEDTVDKFTSVMCDSDLNSFFLSMNSMPADHREKMIANLDLQMKQAREAMTNSIGETSKDRFSKKITHSLQDLYRFFNFFKKKNDFVNPFSNPFLADHIKPLIPLFGIEAQNINVVSEFYFKNQYYDEAAGMFELLDNLKPGNAQIWEKIGYSHDRMHRYEQAIEWYQKADIVNSENHWLDKQMAIALKNAGRGKEAVIYYDKALNNDPENYHLIMSAAQCMLDIGDYERSLKHFYHADYLKPDKMAPQRAIAWTELIAGNFDKAQERYAKLLENPKADKNDILNAAHTSLALANFKEAIALYKKFVDLSENKDITSLVISLRDDAEALKKIGVKTSDLRLIVDKIRYDSLA